MPAESQISDRHLVEQAQAGSFPAFEQLVLRYQSRIFQFILQSCRCQEDACELTQDTFVRAFQSLSTFRPAQHFPPWLFTIARHKCIDHYRRPSIRNRVFEPLPEPIDDLDPGELLASAEERRSLWTLAREVLSTLHFQALWLRYAEDMNIAQIAEVLGVSSTHVKVALFRARQALGGHLGKGLEAASGRPARHRSAERFGGTTRPLPIQARSAQ
jgi:RNA polymerase sigma-70 factor (ECF subfamily)